MIEKMMNLQKCNRKAKVFGVGLTMLKICAFLGAGMLIAVDILQGAGGIETLATWDRVIAGVAIYASATFTLWVANAINNHRIRKLRKELKVY